jgi:hypothetical protein
MRTYESITMSRKIGCGSIFCIFNEESGEFYNLIIKGDNAREAPCGESWLNAMGAILTFALRRSLWEGTAQKALIKHLMNHRCHKIIPNEDHIVSCSDAIGKMVLEYVRSRGLDEIEEKKEVEEKV